MKQPKVTEAHYAVVYEIILPSGTLETRTVYRARSRQEAERWIEENGEGGEYWIHLPPETTPELGSSFV